MTSLAPSTAQGATGTLFAPRDCLHCSIRRCGNAVAAPSKRDLVLRSSRRDLLVSTTLLGAASLAGSPVASAAGLDPAAAPPEAQPAIPRALLAPGLEISRVIKGCWQLSGGHV